MDRAPLLLLLLLGLARVDRQQGGQMSVSAGASLVAYTVPSHGVYPAHTLAASGQLLTSRYTLDQTCKRCLTMLQATAIYLIQLHFDKSVTLNYTIIQ